MSNTMLLFIIFILAFILLWLLFSHFHKDTKVEGIANNNTNNSDSEYDNLFNTNKTATPSVEDTIKKLKDAQKKFIKTTGEPIIDSDRGAGAIELPEPADTSLIGIEPTTTPAPTTTTTSIPMSSFRPKEKFSIKDAAKAQANLIKSQAQNANKPAGTTTQTPKPTTTQTPKPTTTQTPAPTTISTSLVQNPTQNVNEMINKLLTPETIKILYGDALNVGQKTGSDISYLLSQLNTIHDKNVPDNIIKTMFSLAVLSKMCDSLTSSDIQMFLRNEKEIIDKILKNNLQKNYQFAKPVGSTGENANLNALNNLIVTMNSNVDDFMKSLNNLSNKRSNVIYNDINSKLNKMRLTESFTNNTSKETFEQKNPIPDLVVLVKSQHEENLHFFQQSVEQLMGMIPSEHKSKMKPFIKEYEDELIQFQEQQLQEIMNLQKNNKNLKIEQQKQQMLILINSQESLESLIDSITPIYRKMIYDLRLFINTLDVFKSWQPLRKQFMDLRKKHFNDLRKKLTVERANSFD